MTLLSAANTQPISCGMDVAYDVGGIYRGNPNAVLTIKVFVPMAFVMWSTYLSLTTAQWPARLFIDNFTDAMGITGEQNQNDWGSDELS